MFTDIVRISNILISSNIEILPLESYYGGLEIAYLEQ